MALSDESASLSPLPAEYRRGQAAMAVLGMLSLVSSSALFLHITYRLFISMRSRKVSDQQTKHAGVDLSLGLCEDHYRRTKTSESNRQLTSRTTQQDTTDDNTNGGNTSGDKARGNNSAGSSDKPKTPNPLLILIYNLILADVGFSATYIGNIVWLVQDAIVVGSVTCNAQGWLVTFGCLISSAFLLTLATYTYLIVIRGWRPTATFTIVNSVIIWTASIVVACLGPIFTSKEHYFVRQQIWCWIKGPNVGWRLSVYIWGFACIGATFFVYIYTFWALYRKQQSSRHMPQSSSSMSVRSHTNTNGLRPSGHHPAFLMYPFVYMCCATPMTLGSITKLEDSTPFMIFAGILLCSTGFCDALLWSTTIIFSRNEDLFNTGLDQFAFMRTPENRTFGNMIWVQGGSQYPSEDKSKNGGWWMLGRGRNNSDCEVPLRDTQSQNAFQMHPRGIQMDVSTTVVIEEGHDLSRRVDPVTKKLEL